VKTGIQCLSTLSGYPLEPAPASFKQGRVCRHFIIGANGCETKDVLTRMGSEIIIAPVLHWSLKQMITDHQERNAAYPEKN
jgi:hypothetical protein